MNKNKVVKIPKKITNATSNKRYRETLTDYCMRYNKEYLLNEWDWEKNYPLTPNDVTRATTKSVYWIDEKGRSWTSPVRNRTSYGHGSPYEHGKLIRGVNDLATYCYKHKKLDLLLKIINECVDDSFEPTMVHYGSKSKFKFKCPVCGEIYEMSIANKMIGQGCPVCAGKKVAYGKNDAETWCKKNNNAYFLKSFDYKANYPLKPRDFTIGSHKKIYRVCPVCGHKWRSAVKDAIIKNEGCPKCASNLSSSIAQEIYAKEIKKYFNNVIENDRKTLDGLELDIFLPDFNIALEYDGQRYHNDIFKDAAKDDYCQRKNIQLIRIREPECPNYESSSIKINVKHTCFSSETFKDGINKTLVLLKSLTNSDYIIEDFDLKKSVNDIRKKRLELLW